MAGFLSPEKSDLLLAASSSLLSGGTVGQQLGGIGTNALPILQQQREQNKTLQFLDKFAPEIGAKVRAGQPLNLALQEYQQAQAPKKPNYMNAGNGMLFNTDTKEWVQAPAGMAQDDEWGLAPVWGKDASGRTVLGQVSKSGKFKPLDTGDFTPTPTIQNIDTGTAVLGRNSRTGEVVTTTPKDLAGAATQSTLGKTQGEAQATLPAVESTAGTIKQMINSIKTDPYRERGTGGTSVFNSIPATGGYDFQKKVDQLGGQAFLQAIQSMQGFGALSNQEGQTAKDAIARLDTAQSEEAFNTALSDLETIIDRGVAKARAMGGMPTQAQPTQSIQPVQPLNGGKTSTGNTWKLVE